MHTVKSIFEFSTFCVEYLGKGSFKIALGWLMQKSTIGRKSRDTVPLSKRNIKNNPRTRRTLYCIHTDSIYNKNLDIRQITVKQLSTVCTC
jgi:hypothetical protein